LGDPAEAPVRTIATTSAELLLENHWISRGAAPSTVMPTGCAAAGTGLNVGVTNLLTVSFAMQASVSVLPSAGCIQTVSTVLSSVASVAARYPVPPVPADFSTSGLLNACAETHAASSRHPAASPSPSESAYVANRFTSSPWRPMKPGGS
jgi:hypothetical protein